MLWRALGTDLGSRGLSLTSMHRPPGGASATQVAGALASDNQLTMGKTSHQAPQTDVYMPEKMFY